jgi:hypothetical protein
VPRSPVKQNGKAGATKEQGSRLAVQKSASPRIDPTAFWTAAVLSAVFVEWGILVTDGLTAVSDAVLSSFLVPNFRWVLGAIYAIMGLALAYFSFRKGMPNLINTACSPRLVGRVYGDRSLVRRRVPTSRSDERRAGSYGISRCVCCGDRTLVQRRADAGRRIRLLRA